MYKKQELYKMNVKELQEILRNKKRKVKGKKEELIERIIGNQNEVTNNGLPEEGNQNEVTNNELPGKGNGEKVEIKNEPEHGNREMVTDLNPFELKLKRLQEENEQLKAQLGKRTSGKPAIGITKKVSLTLTQEYWEKIDEEANKFGSKSAYIRYIIENFLQ